MAELASHARVVIIGGGAVGASCLYHLAMAGETDVLLIEKNELTSGSTWHAAGNTPNFSGNLNLMKLQNYGSRLYNRLGDEVGYPINRHMTGAVRLAHSKERMQEFEHVASMANAAGMDMDVLSAQELKGKYYPWLETHDLMGGAWDSEDGDIDPAQLTQAFAKGARDKGAKVARFTKVTGLSQRADGTWDVTTDKGSVHAEIVINAAGYYADEIGRMVGRDIPMVTMSHQYLVTEAIGELEALDKKVPLLRDPDDSYYLRQEGNGLILGPYEWQATPHWLKEGTPEDFAFQLYPDDLERLEWYINAACERVPMLATGGVQKVINGPIPYAPDGLPLIGPAPGLTNFFEACVFTFGICQAGGAGKVIAEFITEGETELDLWMVDPRRFTDYATKTYATVKAIEVYQNEYAMHLPHRPWPAGRPAKASPLYDAMAEHGAQFGSFGGWERPLWFAREGDRPEPDLTHGRPHFDDAIAAEVKTVTERAGILDLTGFTRFELSGPGAADWLDGMITGSLPRQGRVSLAYFCAESGRVMTELTITRLADDRFWLIGPAAGYWHDRDWLKQHMPDDGSVSLEDITARYGTLVLAGPKSREILSAIADEDPSNAALPWLCAAPITIGMAHGLVLRVNFVGELGYELHMPMETMAAVHKQLLEAGEAHGIGHFGMYAMDSMRLEKGYRGWKQDLSSEYTPLTSAVDRFVKLNKTQFIGREALLKQSQEGVAERFVAMELEPGDGTEAPYGSPVFSGDQRVGLITSGGFGHRTGKSIALGYVDAAQTAEGTRLLVDIYGEKRPATVVPEVIYDPENERLRA
ncbi:GcvT family protein [Hoeflea poritis]|uniref:FAD-dependent oxidoreductase n=1 Tax=Hoeflea poritis TaxID=2993659 RepID=A0ABT4VKC7_9HYPH|nr:FAD-dependent oxidoreductase [Hoeflea poritis]MDA4844605.1 FAD-dependent oxidoreductase [Hoeflea poritis]